MTAGLPLLSVSVHFFSIIFNMFFFFSSRRRHTRLSGDWSSDVCSSDLSFPSQLEWKIGLAWANTRGSLNSPSELENPAVTREKPRVHLPGRARMADHCQLGV